MYAGLVRSLGEGETIDIVIRNNYAPAEKLYAHVTGSDDKGLMLIRDDGKTVYRPDSPPSDKTLQDLGENCSILIGKPGEEKTIKIPRMSGGRFYFCRGGPLTFKINPGPALVEPSSTNPSDANYKHDWGFCEFTWNDSELYANVSYVDFVSMPISLKLETAGNSVKTVPGMPADCLKTLCSKLEEQGKKDGKGWERLIIRADDGTPLRVVSPNAGTALFPDIFKDYFKSYVESVWDKYKSEDLTINSQKWGDFKGRVKDGKLTFDKPIGSFEKPSTVDIFTCSTGPFAAGSDVSHERLNAGARISAALNRTTLLKNSKQPEGEKVENYYKGDVTNHYARACHETSVEGRGYAFPYDDVGPSKGQDQSGFVNDPKPKVLTISVGKPL